MPDLAEKPPHPPACGGTRRQRHHLALRARPQLHPLRPATLGRGRSTAAAACPAGDRHPVAQSARLPAPPLPPPGQVLTHARPVSTCSTTSARRNPLRGRRSRCRARQRHQRHARAHRRLLAGGSPPADPRGESGAGLSVVAARRLARPPSPSAIASLLRSINALTTSFCRTEAVIDQSPDLPQFTDSIRSKKR